jgi:membrane-associated phospholipid phosphatase
MLDPPPRSRPARLTRPLVTAAAAGAAFVVLTLLVAARVPALERFDMALSEAARRFALGHVRWRTLMSVITHSADSQVLTSVALLTVIVLLWRGRLSWVLFLIAAAVTGTGIRLLVLRLVARPRPVDRLTAAAGWAFPSGHTTSAAVTAGVAILFILAGVRREPLRTALVVTVAGWAVLVGISRVALLAHWPTDVLGGWLVATAVVAGLSLSRLRPRREA